VITYKSEREIDLMKIAGNILKSTRDLLVSSAKIGVSTKDLDEIARNYILSQNATPSFLNYDGFPASICTSINEVIIHGIPNSKDILKSGDILSIDIGVCYKGYHADSAITVPIGKVSDELLKLLEVTEKSLLEGIKQAKPGNYIGDISKAVEDTIKPYGYGIIEEYGGHGIGKNLHEDPHISNFYYGLRGALLKPGMVICIEPMVALGKKEIFEKRNEWIVKTKDKKPCAHFEHMIAITKDGNEILT
jgi:methionyl aminopeptidase